MSVQRKRYSSEEKTKVAVEAMKGQKTINELASEYSVHPTQITQWKKQARGAKSPPVFPEVVSVVKERMKPWWRPYTKKSGT